jgi:hypothetical protein
MSVRGLIDPTGTVTFANNISVELVDDSDVESGKLLSTLRLVSGSGDKTKTNIFNRNAVLQITVQYVDRDEIIYKLRC